jgi:hypothetical protein
MDDLLASVSEETTLMAQRDAAAAQGLDSAEVHRLDGLIVEAMKREVEAEGQAIDDQPRKIHRPGSGWLTRAKYVGVLGAIVSLISLSISPGVPSASAAPSTDVAPAVAALSSPADPYRTPDLVVASATAVTQPSCENIRRTETSARVGDLINGGYWTHLQGVSWVYQVTSVERQKSLQWSKWGYEATAMGVWSIVHVRLQNTGNRNGMPYPYDVQLMDESGTMYDVNRRVSFLYSDYHQLYTFTETVPPGVWIEAGVVTDIAPDVHGLTLCIKQAGTIVNLGD